MEITINSDFAIVAKRVKLPAQCDSIGDARKKASYEHEANFYMNGHAQRLLDAGCNVPRPLYIDRCDDGNVIIVMSKLEGTSGSIGAAETMQVLTWLAKLHAVYWGSRADEAVQAGLQPQGCYWYLDTRPDEHQQMPRSGWEGRLKRAARAIDGRLKADPIQTVCHGDAKDANILFDPEGRPKLYDFQYIGKAPPTKDLAYFLHCGSDCDDDDSLVSAYHEVLCKELLERGDTPPSLTALLTSYDLSCADLGRWMSGWGWWGRDLQPRIKRVLDKLDGGVLLGSEEEYEAAMQREFAI